MELHVKISNLLLENTMCNEKLAEYPLDFAHFTQIPIYVLKPSIKFDNGTLPQQTTKYPIHQT